MLIEFWHYYASCSPIFIKEKGVFLVCFPMIKFKDESSLDEEYFSSIGTYMQLVLENCDTPILLLVATKCDLLDNTSVNAQMASLLSTAKEHLEAIANKSENKKPFLFDRVFQTSLDPYADLQYLLDDLINNLVAVFGHPALMDVKLRTVPKSWRKTVDFWKENHRQVNVEQAVVEYQQLIERDQYWLDQHRDQDPDNQDENNLSEDWKTATYKLMKSIKAETEAERWAPFKNLELSSEGAAIMKSTPESEAPQVVRREELNAQSDPEGPTFRPGAPATVKQESEKESHRGIREEPKKPKNRLKEARRESEEKKIVEGILTFFSSDNEVLWFRFVAYH